MKRRIFLSASALVGAGTLANASSLKPVGHYLNYQLLSKEQQQHLEGFKKDLKAGSAPLNLVRINTILSSETTGKNYELCYRAANNDIVRLVKKENKRFIKINV